MRNVQTEEPKPKSSSSLLVSNSMSIVFFKSFSLILMRTIIFVKALFETGCFDYLAYLINIKDICTSVNL